METLHRGCAGRDVPKKAVVACVRSLGPDGKAVTETRTLGTMTARWRELADGLEARGVRQVAMESTGVDWKPVFYLLEDRFEAMVVNARHIKNVPGRKTDVKDAEWIAPRRQHGLLRPSFVPPPSVRELRDLTRQRTQLVRDRATVVNRIRKVLEDADIKLASVATDVLGVSGRARIRELIAGNTAADDLAALARARLRATRPELRQALDGRVTDHHRFPLRMRMQRVEHLEGWVAELGARIETVMGPFSAAARKLAMIPGVGPRAAEVIVAEIGDAMKKFPTAGHLASRAGVCPGNDQSAGKRRSGKTTKGSQWLRTVLVPVAWAASPTKETIFAAADPKWAKRLGKKKALVAVAHKILVVAYKLLKDNKDYQERWTPAQAG